MGQRGRRACREGGRRLLSTAHTTVLDLSTAEELCTEPGALERVRRAYAGLAPGARLEVRSLVAEHAFAVRAWARKTGVAIVDEGTRDGVTRLVLEVAHPAA